MILSEICRHISDGPQRGVDLAGPAPPEATILYADLDLGRITRGHLALDVDATRRGRTSSG